MVAASGELSAKTAFGIGAEEQPASVPEVEPVPEIQEQGLSQGVIGCATDCAGSASGVLWQPPVEVAATAAGKPMAVDYTDTGLAAAAVAGGAADVVDAAAAAVVDAVDAAAVDAAAVDTAAVDTAAVDTAVVDAAAAVDVDAAAVGAGAVADVADAADAADAADVAAAVGAESQE